MMNSEESNSFESTQSNEQIDVSAIHQPAVLIAGHNRWEWAFVVFSILSSGLLIAPSVLIFLDHTCIFSVQNYCFLMEVLICISTAIGLMFTVYGVFWEHKYDMYLHCVWLGIALYFSWISLALGVGKVFRIRMILNSVGIATWLCSALFAFKATHVADWIEYRLVGVSDSLAVMYTRRCQFLAILKFNSFLIVIFQVYRSEMSFAFHSPKFWYIFHGIIICYAFLIWLLGKITVRNEELYLAYAFNFVHSCFIVSVVVELCCGIDVLPTDSYKLTLLSSSAAFGGLLVFNSFILMFFLKAAYFGFGYGLNSKSFLDLVSRNSNNLLASSRSAVLY